MTSGTSEGRVRRIKVVFGGGSSDRSVAGVLAALALEGAPDIAALFLEDHTLFRLAELPFATEICRITTTQRPVTASALARQLRVQASRAEQAVKRIAERAGSSWSFRTHRGRLGTALATARDVDVLLLGPQRGSLVPSGELSETARSVHSHELVTTRPVAVLLDQADTAARTLEHGMRFAQLTGRRLIVFLSDEAAKAHPFLTRPLESVRSTVQRVSTSDLGALFVRMRRTGPGVLMVSEGEAGFVESSVDALRRQLSCPVLVISTPGT
ncbi:MAG: hypothetical protein HKP46_05900 [Myxococcales bacterium]|nr:hypothetical protein [Myxococcales bacterium]